MSEPVAVPVTPSEPVAKTVKQIGGVDSSIIDTSSLDDYQSTKGQPYVAEFFGIDSHNDEFVDLISDVDEWLFEATDGSVGMAKGELETIFNILNLKGDDSGFHNINKVIGFINLKRQQNEMDNMQEQAERDIIDGITDESQLKAEQNTINALKAGISKQQDLVNKARKKALADIRRMS